MTEANLRSLEPFFDRWYIDGIVAKGKNSLIYKVSGTTENGEKECRALEIMKIPGSDEEISRVIESGKFATIDEYLAFAEKTVCENIEKMMSFKEERNIIRYDDYKIVKESSCFYVFILRELLTPLSDFIKGNLIKQKDAVKIGWDICTALENFRRAGITHRNIKTENIFVAQKGTYKLGDFGVDSLFRKRSKTETYRAPEVGTAEEFSSDLYALGIVLYKLLNKNRSPFLARYPEPVTLEDREAANLRRLRGDLFPMPENADKGLAHIIFTATAFRTEDRYASPSQMKLALEEYVKAVIEGADAPSSEYHTRKITYVSTQTPTRRSDGADSVTEKDKQIFAEVFKDDDVAEEKKDYKKWYILIGALAVVLVVMVAVLIKSFSSDNSGKVNNTAQNNTYVSDTITTEPSTTQSVTEESTGADITETTEESTTQQETTEETTEATTEETTETTTEAETTEATTEETTEEQTTVEPTEATPSVSAGDTDEGSTKTYYDLSGGEVVFTPQDEEDKELVIEIRGVQGNEPKINSGVFVYMVNDGSLISRSDLVLTNIEKTGEGNYYCYMTAMDYDFYYDPGNYEYYVIFTAGSVETDTSLNTEKRIDF